MSWTAFLLIASSIVLHSLWHFLCKSSGKSSIAFFALFSTALFLTMLPFALISGVAFQLHTDTLQFIAVSSFFAFLGDLGLMLAYKYADISLAYPMARALPVFMTMAATLIFSWGAPLSPPAVAGMIIIFTGCMLMGLSGNNSRLSIGEKLAFIRKALPGILLAALSTTAYTLSDGYGIKSIMTAFPGNHKLLLAGCYSCLRELLVTAALWIAVFCCRAAGKERGILKSLAASYHPYAAGIFAALAYVLVLLAMNYVTNVSFVQAFRQLSLPLSALLGALILKEKIGKLRAAGLIMIMAGLFLSIL